MNAGIRNPRVGDRVLFWPAGGDVPIGGDVTRVWSPSCVNLQLDNGETPTSVLVMHAGGSRPELGYYCEFITADREPAEKPLRVTNPVASVQEWLQALDTADRPARLKTYEALCMEEMGETFLSFEVFSTENPDVVNVSNEQFGQGLIEASRIMRAYDEMRVRPADPNKLVDAHLDSAWVHLCAAAVLVGIPNLGEAWSRLHNANVVGKQVDGQFVFDSTGKVVKPSGWTAPDYTDLIKTEILL